MNGIRFGWTMILSLLIMLALVAPCSAQTVQTKRTAASSLAVQDRQAFAWNPTVMGAKVEDTILVFADHMENLTETPGWPVIVTTIGGKAFHSPDILIRTAATSRPAKKR